MMVLPVEWEEEEEGVHQFLWYMDCDYKEQTETTLSVCFHLTMNIIFLSQKSKSFT
jgi:hypothetical protein